MGPAGCLCSDDRSARAYRNLFVRRRCTRQALVSARNSAARSARLLRRAVLDGRDRFDLLPHSKRAGRPGVGRADAADFIVHIKAFGVMTRHPVPIARLPPELRDELPVDERGRVDRPSREARALVFCEFLRGPRAVASGRQARRHPVPVSRPTSSPARPRSTTSTGRATSSVTARCSSSSGTARGSRRTGARRCSASSSTAGCRTSRVDAPRLDAANVPPTLVAATTPLAYVRFHGRNARDVEPPRRRSGAALRLSLYGRASSPSGSSRCASSPASSQTTYALFNNNNATDGAAQAPAGATLLQRLLDAASVPVA